jgi:FkbM family methyltransferase
MKKFINGIFNGILLKPFGLKLGYRIGGDPIEDIVRLTLERPIKTIVDGGAYVGAFSKSMTLAFPEAIIHAFEPTPASYDLLTVGTSMLPRIRRHRNALGAQHAISKFYANSSPLTNSLRQSSEDGHKYFVDLVKGEAEVQVEVVALSDFAQAHHINSFDVVKLDLQGNEHEALRGMGELLMRTQVALIEVQFVSLYEGAPLFCDIELLMRDKGLVLYQFYELVRSPRDGRLLYGDALFISSDLLKRS